MTLAPTANGGGPLADLALPIENPGKSGKNLDLGSGGSGRPFSLQIALKDLPNSYVE